MRLAGKVYRVRLEDGRAKIKLVKFTKPGRYRIKIRYLGTDTFEAFRKVVRIRVRRS